LHVETHELGYKRMPPLTPKRKLRLLLLLAADFSKRRWDVQLAAAKASLLWPRWVGETTETGMSDTAARWITKSSFLALGGGTFPTAPLFSVLCSSVHRPGSRNVLDVLNKDRTTAAS
jgi:hypothetical protein